MSPSTSLRSALAYASNLLAQLPVLQDMAAPFSTLIDPALESASEAVLGSNHVYDGEITPYDPLSGAPACPIDGPLSCHNKTPIDGDGSCCLVAPGGRILLTQFWDRDAHVGGAEESWTLHGLWPDLCDGTYDAYCNMTPRFTNITDILSHYGQEELLAFMDSNWIADRGSNEHLWAHEYSKHATCINTLSPKCYGDTYEPGQEVVDYFTRATGLFKMLDTYTALTLAGIVPSQRKHYPIEDVRGILEQFSGGRVVLRCGGRKRDELHEAWYVYFIQGSLQTGQFVPAQHHGFEGNSNNCAPWVKYLPKKSK